MIIINYTDLGNGLTLAHLHCQVGEKQTHFKSEIFANKDKAVTAVHKWLCKWMRDRLAAFITQRKVAYKKANCQHEYEAIIHRVASNVLAQHGYLGLCNAILASQDSIRYLIPGEDSAHHYWAQIIENIIHHAYQISNPQWERPLSRPTQFPDKRGPHMANQSTSK